MIIELDPKPDLDKDKELVRIHKEEIKNNKKMIKYGASLLSIKTYIKLK